MTKIPSVEEVVDNFGKQFDALKMKPPKKSMPGLERELLKDFMRKSLTAEREAGARVAALERYQAISKIMNNLLSSDVTRIARDIYNYRDRADSQIEALTPHTK